MSAKNTLQEYFQKRGGRLPRYEYVREGGPDHDPFWSCTVTCYINDTTRSFPSEICGSKVGASTRAAEIALECVHEFVETEEKDKEKVSLRTDVSHTFLLLDLENVPHAYRDLCTLVELPYDQTSYTMVGFCSKAAPHIRTKVENEAHLQNIPIRFIEANSHTSDAADVQLVLWMGELMASVALQCNSAEEAGQVCADIDLPLMAWPLSLSLDQECLPMRILCVTADHFGKALVDIVGTERRSAYYPKMMWHVDLVHSIREISE